MEAFALLKFWKSNTAKVAAGTTITAGDSSETASVPHNSDHPMAPSDDDDSFFELELTLPNEKQKQERQIDTEPSLIHKPQSPISIFRSAPPNLRVLIFGKFNRRRKKDEVETKNVSKRFTVKFKIEDGSIVSELSRTDNSSSSLSISNNKYHRRSFDDCCESSKRFSKDVVQKSLHLIKPLYVKSSNLMNSPPRKQKEEKKSRRFKVKCRQLGKSKSVSSVIGASSLAPVCFPARSEHCFDGIEGAILHCKRSLCSSRGL